MVCSGVCIFTALRIFEAVFYRFDSLDDISFERNKWSSGNLISFVITVVVSTFLVLQPDFGQACLILFGWSVVYFIAGAHILLLVGVAGGAIGLGSFAYISSEHFARRIDGFLSPI